MAFAFGQNSFSIWILRDFFNIVFILTSTSLHSALHLSPFKLRSRWFYCKINPVLPFSLLAQWRISSFLHLCLFPSLLESSPPPELQPPVVAVPAHPSALQPAAVRNFPGKGGSGPVPSCSLCRSNIGWWKWRCLSLLSPCCQFLLHELGKCGTCSRSGDFPQPKLKLDEDLALPLPNWP